MSVSEIVGIAVPVAIALLSVVANIITLCKKNKKATVLQILANVPAYVSQAEQIFGKGCGPAKLQWVVTKIQLDSVKANVDISETDVKQAVEGVLSAPEKKQDETTRPDIQN